MMNQIRMTRKMVSALAPLLIGFTSCTTAQKSMQPTELFNGKDLAGWQAVLADPAVPMSEVWGIQDGVITCQGKPLGLLYHDPVVRDFRMQVEYRWPPGTEPSNSGIFSRIAEPYKALPCAVEVQLHHGDAGDVLGLQGKSIAGGQPRFFEVKKHAVAGDITGVRKILDAENPPGEWNRVEILAQGARYQVWVNGKLVNDVSGVELSPGRVGIQSEGGAIQFRRVTLTRLD